MIKTLQILCIVLIVQAVLVGILHFSDGANQAIAPSENYLSFDMNDVDKIVIDGKESSVTLTKSGDAWELPDYAGLAVKETKIETFIDKLKAVKTRWPVATTDGAAERFEVSKENAQKAITFYNGDSALETLYLGTSPGFKKVHARMGDVSDIFAIAFAQHEAPDNAKDWFDTSLLNITSDITEVSDGQFTLTLQGEKWIVTPSTTNQIEKEEDIQNWIKRFASLTVNALADAGTTSTLQDAQALKVLNIKTTPIPIELTFYKHGDKHYIKSSVHDNIFEIASYQVEPLISANLETFLDTSENSTEEETDNAGGQ